MVSNAVIYVTFLLNWALSESSTNVHSKYSNIFFTNIFFDRKAFDQNCKKEAIQVFYYFLHFQGKYAFINVRHMILQKIVVYIKTTLVMEFQDPIVSSFQKIWSWNLFLKTYSCNEFISFHYVSNFHTSQVWKSFLKKLKKS